MCVKQKTIVVTGAASGIGRELSLALLKKGARVAALDINEEGLQETLSLSNDNGENMSLHTINITDKDAVSALPEKIIEKHGSIDGLINNAGIIQPFVKVNDLEYDSIKKVIDINFWGVIYLTKGILPYLYKRSEAHIVNVSSMGGFLPVPGQTLYGASKAAVKLLTEGLYSELRDTNIRVTIVFPGAIATNISSNSGLVDKDPEKQQTEESRFKALPAPKAAEIIIKAIEKNKFRVCVGKDARTMDLLYRLFPKYATNMIAKKMASLLG